MAKLIPNGSNGDKCTGGRSLGCRHDEHEASKEVRCYRCKTRMGCSRCCEPPRELICLECHNWAQRIGVHYHGKFVPNIKVPKVRTDAGWTTHHPLSDDVNRFYSSGFEF